jgi:uncharacterized protein HemY
MRWIDLFVDSGMIPSKLYHAVDRFVLYHARRVLKYLDMRWTSALDLCMLVHYIFMAMLLLHLLSSFITRIGHGPAHVQSLSK